MTISRRDFIKSSTLLAGGAATARMGLSPAIAHAQPTDPAARQSAQILDDGWEYFEGPLGGVWEVWHFKPAQWQAVTLPHCFNHYDACGPDKPAYRGHGWYRTRLKIANPYPDGRTLLHFGAAGQRATVYAGSSLAGENIGGYNEFIFDVTDAANASGGEMPVAVLCDNSSDLETIPSDFSDFNLYGGLYRHVSLVYVPAIAIETVHVHTEVEPGQPVQCSIQARLHNPASLTTPLTIAIEVASPDGTSVFSRSISLNPWQDLQEIAQFMIAGPKLWSPSSPSLYQCKVSVKSTHGEQAAVQRFGLRHIDFTDHGPFLLNGEKLFLRGTHRHEDHANYAAAVPDDITRRELQMIKEMGANFIRLTHYQQSELVLDLCDELGLVVWEELPWCRAGVGGAQFQQMSHRLLRTMIDQHFNHPSIAFWSLGNEDDWPGEYPSIDKDAIRSFMQGLSDLAHQLDASRLTSFRRCSFAGDIPDVYSPSIWMGWYHGTYPEYQQALEEQRNKIRHFLHIEWGADCQARRHAEEPYEDPYKSLEGVDAVAMPAAHKLQLPISRYGDWSETYACDLYDWHLKVQETLPWFAGSAHWIFKDFSTPDRPENPTPRVNQKGLTERDLTRKEGYYVFQSYWTEEPMVHIYGHTWPVRWGKPGEPRMVRVYSNCDSAELFLNGKSCGVKKRNSQDFPCAGLRWNPAFAEGRNTLRAVARKGPTTITDEVEFIYQTAAWGTPAVLQLAKKSSAENLVTVEAKLFDKRGVLCLDARNRVRFSIAGAGRLNDNLGTSTGSRVVEMYNGRAEISLFPNQGPSVVSVTSAGLAPAFLRID